MTEDLTQDDFLGGRLRIWQPRKGYRAGVDPVLLAAAVPAQAGDTVLELGCGVGVASLCLAARVGGLDITGVELQPAYADLARRNGAANDVALRVITADLRALPDGLRQRQFHHVIMNPPYFNRQSSTSADDAGRDIALGGDTDLGDWLDVGIRRVTARGYLTLIQRIERLPEVLSAIEGRLGAIIVRPIAGRGGKAPERFLLQARQDGRTPFRLAPTLVMHDGAQHEADQESYTTLVRNVLRQAAALPISG